MPPAVLTINGGSSSIRFAVFSVGDPPVRLLVGNMQRIGSADASWTVQEGSEPVRKIEAQLSDPRSAVDSLVDWLQKQSPAASLAVVGHRIVHGMRHMLPEKLTPALLEDLKRIQSFDPEHLPREIALIESLQRRLPNLPQVLCFDTAFHRNMPPIAKLLPIPRRYAAQGVHRYGFHGLSYTFLLEELKRLGDPAASRGKVILAHLGSGASLAAVQNGQCIDTSMGFTPTAGLVMGTRSGDLDPGLMSYLATAESMAPEDFQRMVNHESGMLGISETSADVRDLLAAESTDERAAEALAVFCYQTKKWIGAFTAALGGLNTLVFAGGIGENTAVLRARICESLGYLGIQIDAALNERHAACISRDGGAVAVRVIRTDEESVIARSSIELLGLEASPGV